MISERFSSQAVVACAYLGAVVLGVAAAWISIGSPAYILSGGMIADADYANAAAAFAIFVQDGLQWPLGANPNFGGVNVFYSDACPWFALLSKGIRAVTGFAPSFHWLILINFALFSAMALRLMRRLTISWATCWLGVAMLAFSIVMPVRIFGPHHISLASYWVVLWAMACVPMRGETASGWRRWEFLAVVAFATWSHGYIAAMSITIVLFCLLDARRWLSLIVAIVLPLILLWLIGALGQSWIPMSGAKVYGLDLAAYLSSTGWGFPPQLYTILEIPQGEPIVYIGTGTLLALVVSVGWAMLAGRAALVSPDRTAQQSRRLLVIAAAGIALTLFAMAFNVRIAGLVRQDVPIPSFLAPLYETFRVAGRFGAVLSFVSVVVAALWLGSLTKGRPALVLLSIVAVGLQAGDLIHAGRNATDGRQAVLEQGQAIKTLLKGSDWSGNVFRDVGFLELEQQRLIDYLLVEAGARHFRVAHGARLVLEEVRARSGYAAAKTGDLVIVTGERPVLSCRTQVTIKQFELCILAEPA